MTAAKTTRKPRTKTIVPKGPFTGFDAIDGLIERANDPRFDAVTTTSDPVEWDRALAEIENRWRDAVHDSTSYDRHIEPHPSQPLPVGDWAVAITFPANATPDEKVDAIMARLNDAWDEENGVPLDVPGAEGPPVSASSEGTVPGPVGAPPSASPQIGPGTPDDDDPALD